MLFSGIIFATIGILVFAFTMTAGYDSEDRYNAMRQEQMYLLQREILSSSASIEKRPDDLKDIISRLQAEISAAKQPTNISAGTLIMRYLMMNSRALGMLLFIETISWFLLRQYRSLVEDYKWFYRLYIKRQNYLVAFLITQHVQNSKDARALVSNALLNEDLSGRLPTGSTTEALENLKLVDQNPIMAVTQLLAGQLGYVMSPVGADKSSLLRKLRGRARRNNGADETAEPVA
jgi:hypothetical protein